jgi:SAM-dependent methyltransferase
MSNRLRLLTRSLDEQFYESEYSDDQFFYESYRQAYHFSTLLEKFDFNFRTCGAILDFGCGSARILRLFRYISGVRLLGADANPERVLNQQGEVTLGKDDPGVSFSTKAGGSQFDVFQRRDKVIDVFGRVLKMLDYIPSSRAPIGQDLLVLQKI